MGDDPNYDYATIECREDDCEERIHPSDGSYCCEHDPAQQRIRELRKEVEILQDLCLWASDRLAAHGDRPVRENDGSELAIMEAAEAARDRIDP